MASDSEDEHPSFALDSLHSLGGGSAHFRMFGISTGSSSAAPMSYANTTTASSLPPPPAPFEDFQYSSGLGHAALNAPSPSFRLAPGASPINVLSPPQPSSFTSMFDSQSTADYHTSQSNGYQHHQHLQDSHHHKYYPSPHPPPPPQHQQPTNLFDDSESALFSSFLNTLDVDPNFLFNPVLPPGMPSPPTAIPHDDEVRERDRLGMEVGGMSLDTNPSGNDGLAVQSRDTVIGIHEPHEHSLEDEDEDEDDEEDDHNADPDFGATVSASGSGSIRRGRSTRGATDNFANSRTKKIKVEDQTMEGDDVDKDVEMDNANDESTAATATIATRGTRGARGKRATTAGGGAAAAAGRRASSSTARSTKLGRTALASQQDDYAVGEDESGGDDEEDAEFSTTGANVGGGDRKPILSDTQKRSNHIQSEQKRRNAIRNGFKDLVDLLAAGEQASGIVVAPPEAEQYDANGKKKKTKGTGRGRGRKGEVGAGASKSVVLEKATQYILWLERGNEGIEAEIERVENHLKAVGIQVP
ncbi:hypothetical protein ACM66B_003068 [Microbotryomycetes sp. NB124-2]